MAKFRDFLSNFSSGLLSPGMLGRIDLAAYRNGCAVLTNWWPKVTGGVRRRPGTMFLARVDDATSTNSNQYRSEPFIFNETQRYIIVFSRFRVRAFSPDDGTEVWDLTNTDPDVIPWFNSTTIQRMDVHQLGDTMFITHNDFFKVLKRTSATTFELSDYEFEKSPTANTYPHFAPFYKFADPEVTLKPSGTESTVTFDASADVFDSSYLGRLMRYRGKQFVVSNYISPTRIEGDVKEELPSSANLIFGGALGFGSGGNANDFIVGEVVVGRDSGIKAIVAEVITNANIHVSSLAGQFDKFPDSEEIEGLDSGNVMFVSAAQTITPVALADWDEIAFSDARGWPGTLSFHSQRLWLGGSSSLPAHIFGSKLAAFFNFDVGDGFPDESIQALIADQQVGTIVDIVSGNHLMVLTDAAEFYAPETEDQPLTPERFNLLPQTRFGTKPGTRGYLLDEGVIFIQSKGKAVRELVWSDRVRKYQAEPISLLSEESIEDVQEIAVLYGGYERPEHFAFFRNKERDGFVSWYHTARTEQIRAWGIWSTQKTPTHNPDETEPVGEQSSQNAGPISLTTMQDKLYWLCARNIWDGSQGQYVDKIFLERFELDATMDAQMPQLATLGPKRTNFEEVHPELLYCGVDVTSQYSPDGSSDDWGIPGSDNSAEPDYYLGNYYLTEDEEQGQVGNLDLDISVYNIQAGLGFTQSISPMPPEVQLSDGFTGGMPKRIVSADVLLASTLAIRDEDGAGLLTMQVNQDPSLPPERFDGMQKFYFWDYSERPNILLENPHPLPCEVTSISLEVEF